MPFKCLVHNCGNQSVATGLCRKHYMQKKRHGVVGDTRAYDWGQREKHSAYKSWCGIRRYHSHDMPTEWLNDFWNFVKDVGECPEKGKAFRPDKSKPWSKDNFYWKEVKKSSEDRKEYMRLWRKKSRAANVDYYVNLDLKKLYGVTLDWYKSTLEAQGGVCAICKNPETHVIRGKKINMPVDHCHNTGKVRGLLCTKCNQGLGFFSDQIDRLQSAIDYLSQFKTV